MLLHTLSALVRLHELTFYPEEHAVRASVESGRCESEISPEVMKEYRRQLTRHGETALVALKNRTCTGCFIQQSLSALEEIGPQIYQCQHCGRLMYRLSELYDEAVY